MADANAGDLFLATAGGSYAGQRIMFTHNYRLEAVDPGVSTGLATATLNKGVRGDVTGDDLLETSYLLCLPQNYSLLYWRTQLIEPQRYVGIDFARDVTGLIEEDAVTGNVAGVVTLRTDKAGRNQVSNKHIGPVPTSGANLESGTLKAAYKALLARHER